MAMVLNPNSAYYLRTLPVVRAVDDTVIVRLGCLELAFAATEVKVS